MPEKSRRPGASDYWSVSRPRTESDIPESTACCAVSRERLAVFGDAAERSGHLPDTKTCRADPRYGARPKAHARAATGGRTT